MMGVRLVVIALQPLDGIERIERFAIARRSQPRKQALLFVGRVSRRRGCEVRQRAFEVCAFRVAKHSTVDAGGDRDQDAEKVLDPSMTVAQQSKRFVKAVVRPLSNL
jgi:hypothetical protein